jgi:four helix bundle protein
MWQDNGEINFWRDNMKNNFVKAKNYQDLDIYKMSYILALKVHKISLKLPKYEMFEEGSQVRKSSKGIPSCIVEGYGRKRYKAEFVKFLTYAHASCDETIVHLNFIKDLHEIVDNEIEFFLTEYNKLGRKINKYIQYVHNEWR